MHWIIQKNFISNQVPYINALTDLNIPFSLVDLSNDGKLMTAIPKGHKIWAFGSVALAKELSKDPSLSPGVIYNKDSFSFASMLKNYKDACLNFDAEILAIKDIKTSRDQIKFIRPNVGQKIFAGTVLAQPGLEDFKKNVRKGKFSFNENELIVLANPKSINEEYRIFVVDNTIVAGCQYMIRGSLYIVPGIPKDVLEFVNHLIGIWTPEVAFVIDIARTHTGLKAIEINGINSAGPYGANIKDVVLALEHLFGQ